MRKTYILIYSLILSLFCNFKIFSQDFPIYSTLFNNLYAINPSLAGEKGITTLYLTYHKQIIGNLNDAPYNGLLNLHSPIGKTRSSVGFNAQTFKRSLINTTNALFTFAHRIDFDNNHNIRFGISGGILSYAIDTDKLSADEKSDPALVYRLNNKIKADGQFGANYQLKNFQFGVSFPKLFTFYYIDQNVNSSRKELYPLRNFLLTASYDINISSDLVLKPLIIFRKLEYEYSNSNIELNGTLIYQKIGWFGVSYRQKYGTAFLIGLKVKDYLSFGYTYKIVNSEVKNYNNAAHEIQLGIFFGKMTKPDPSPIAETIKPDEKIKEVETVIKKEKIEDQKIETKIIEPKIEVNPKSETRIEVVPEKKSSNPLEMSQGNYVVVGAFKIKKNATNYTQQLKDMGYQSKMGFNSSTQIYYVFIYRSNEINQATKEMDSFKSVQGFENTWILTVTK